MMIRIIEMEKPKSLPGKTFCLFGKSDNTNGYYAKIAFLIDELVMKCADERELLSLLQCLSRKRRNLSKITKKEDIHTLKGQIVINANEILTEYTAAAETHLNNISFREKFNRTISTSREQYHLYMLEVELTNRINKETFRNCDYKVAFLPHCVRDWTKKCQASTVEYDYICKACSRKCYINAVSKILEENGVIPYIWMEANLKSMFGKLKAQKKTVGVFGMACVPELVRGLRRCEKYRVPAVGVPLNANRCRRWMGEFYANSVDLGKVEGLVKKGRNY